MTTLKHLPPGTYKCLSVWQPWAWAIFHGKGIENRNWPTRYRGPLLIHASKTKEGLDHLETLSENFKLYVLPNDLVFGAILGMVELYDCQYSLNPSRCGWGEYDSHHWKLRNQVLLDQPIPFQGKQGLFTVHIPIEPVPGSLLL